MVSKASESKKRPRGKIVSFGKSVIVYEGPVPLVFIGGATGGGLGAALGYLLARTHGALIGGALGAALGGWLGSMFEEKVKN